MCEYCEEIFVSNGNYNAATGRIEKIKTTKPMQCYAGDIRNDGLKTIWISNIRDCHELFVVHLTAIQYGEKRLQ